MAEPWLKYQQNPSPLPSFTPTGISDDEDGSNAPWLKYSAQKKEEAPSFTDEALNKAKEFGKLTVENLPGLGAMAGGVIGGVAGNVPGAVAGAGVGGYLGEAGKNLINSYIEPELAPQTTQEYLTRPIIAGAGGIAGEALGHGIGNLIFKAKGVAPKIAARLGETFTGVPEKELATYATKTNLINKMIDESGGNVTVAADLARDKMQTGLRATKNKLNQQISKVLDLAPTEQTISIEPIVKNLEVAKAKLNPNLQEDAVNQINELLGKIKTRAVMGQDGQFKAVSNNNLVSLKELQEIKNYLMENAGPAYLKGGQLFSKAPQAAKAAKSATTETLRILNPLAPEISAANKQLSQLHSIENRLNKNLISPGTPEGALLAAGGAPTSRNATVLEGLGKITGQDLLGKAQELATVKRFSNPSFIPVDPTGKSTTRLLTGPALGMAAGGLIGGKEGAVVGGAIGGGLTSPAAIKVGINLANRVREIAQSAGNTKVFGKFSPVIESAIKRGPEALAVTGTMLANDPEFQEIIGALSSK